MKVKLDRQEELLELVPCLYQFEKNTLFARSAVGITKNDVVIYPDMGPSVVNGDLYIYNPIFTIGFDEIISLVVSKIKNNRDLKKYIRLDIFSKSTDACKILYVLKSKRSKLMNLIKIAKKGKVKTAFNSINYGLGTR